MKDIKVLHLGLTNNKGGTEAVLYSWAKNIPEGFQFDIVNAMGPPLAWEDEFRQLGCNIVPVTKRSTSYKGYISDLKKVIEEGGYDYVHFHAMSYAWPESTLLACKYSKGQAIIHSHSVLNEYYPKKYQLLDKLGRVLLANKKYLRLACGEEAGLSMFKGKPFVKIENGIDVDKYHFSEENRKKIRKRYAVDDNTILIGHVGRSGIEKNYPHSIKSFAELCKRQENCKLMLIGNMDKDEEVLRLIQESGIEDRVILTGRIEDTSVYYSAMDIFYLPSVYEGLPVVMVEAQACGLPCVTSVNVTRESDVGGTVHFVSIDAIEESVSVLSELAMTIASDTDINIRDRMQASIKPEYNYINSDKKIFDYYKDHLNR